MKNPLSIIRWKYVLPTLIFVAALLIFFILFFDPLLAKAVEWGGSKANGAKVDVTGLRTKLLQGRLMIKRLQVTDKDHTMKNVVEAGPMAFELDFGQLFSKRVIIPQASLEGLKFNTDRKRDGRLRRVPKKVSPPDPSTGGGNKPTADQKPGMMDKLTETAQDRFQLQLDSLKSSAKAKIEFDPKSLHLTQQYESLKAKSETLPDVWKKKVETLDFDGRIKKLQQDIKEIENTPTKGSEALQALPESLKKISQAKSDLNKIKTDLKTAKEDLQTEVKTLKNDIAGLKDAKKKDVDELLSRLNLDFANPKKLAEGLVGKDMWDKIQTALRYAALIRKNMPAKKDAEAIPQHARTRGMDISFPRPATPPRFWLKKASLSGEFGDIAASGVMTHATSDPPRVGQPLKVDLKGDKDGQRFLADLIADHTGDVAKDSLRVQAQNLPVTKLISSGLLGSALTAGFGDMELALSITGAEELGGHLSLNMQGLKLNQENLLSAVGVDSTSTLSTEDSLKASFMKSVGQGLEKMGTVQLSAQITGTLSNPDFSLTTNLDNMLKNVVKDSVGNVVQDQKKELEGKLNALLDSHKADLDKKVAQLQPKLTELLGGYDQPLQNVLGRLTKSSGSEGGKSPLPVKIPSLDKLFK